MANKKEEPAGMTEAEEKTVETLSEQSPESKSVPRPEEEIFRLGQPKLESAIKVTGKIDLSSINQSMRPKKKSKE